MTTLGKGGRRLHRQATAARRWSQDSIKGIAELRRGGVDINWYRFLAERSFSSKWRAVAHYTLTGARQGLSPRPPTPPRGELGEPERHWRQAMFAIAADAKRMQRFINHAPPVPRDARSENLQIEHELATHIPDGELGVSIILPVRNRADVVSQAIDSVVAQSLSHWELLVIDDHSSDDLARSVRRYSSDSRIRLIENDGDGVSAARNTGLGNARGKYIAYIDSDDKWLPSHLATLISSMEFSLARAAYSDYILVDPSGRSHRRGREGGLADLAMNNFIALPTLIHERSLLTSAGGFDPGLVRCVDYDLIVRLAKVAELHHVPVVTCEVRTSSVGESRITASTPPGDCFRIRARALEELTSRRPRHASGDVEIVLLIDDPRSANLVTVESAVRSLRQQQVDVTVVGQGFRSVRWFVELEAIAAGLGAGCLSLHEPRRYGIATRVASRLSRAEVIVFTAFDLPQVNLLPDWSRQIFKESSTTIAQPLVVSPSRRLISAGYPASPSMLSAKDAEGSLEPSDIQRSPLVSTTSHLWAIRRAPVDQLGGIDAAYCTGVAAIDLGQRLSAGGQGRVVLDTSAEFMMSRTPEQECPSVQDFRNDVAWLRHLANAPVARPSR